MKFTYISLMLLLMFGTTVSAQDADVIADEDAPPLPEASFPNRIVPLGDGIFLIVRDNGLSKTCVAKTTFQFKCGGWQRLPK